MKSTTCEAHLEALADWVDMTYTSVRDFNIVAQIATDEERIRWAKIVLGIHRRSPELERLLTNLTGTKKTNDAECYIALRQAFVCLAEGKYKARVRVYFGSLPSRKGFMFVSNVGNLESSVVAV